MRKLGINEIGNVAESVLYGNGEAKQFGIVIPQIKAHGASAEVKGVYTLSLTTQAVAGDKLTINDTVVEFGTNTDNGKIKIGASLTADAASIQTKLTALPEFNQFTITTSTSNVIFTQKSGGIGAVPTIAVVATALVATIATTTEGVEALANARPAGLELKKGALIGKRTADGKYFPFNPNATDGTQNLFGVLGEDINSIDGDAKTFCYVSGEFKRAIVAEASGIHVPEGVYNGGTILIKNEG